MKIQMSKVDTPPSAEKISSAEAVLGTKFTNEYLDFLWGYNGAIPEANVFRISDQNSAGVSAFVPIEKVAHEASLMDMDVTAEFFPIAYAEGGNYLCMPLSSSKKSGIYFCDHEIPGLESLTKLAESLRDFLDQLRPINRNEIKLKPGQVKKAWIDPRFLK